MTISTLANAMKKGKRPEISHKEIHLFEDPKHPLWDPRIDLPLDEDTLADIRANGIRQNVLLWNDGGCLWPIAGLQRIKYAIEIEKRYGEETGIPFTIVNGTTGELLKMRAAENAHRINPSSMTNAYNARALLVHFPPEEVAIAMKLGTTANLNIILRLNDLDPRLGKLVDSGEVGQTLAALELSKLPQDEESAKKLDVLTQWQMYEKLKDEGNLKGEAAKSAIREVREKNSDTKSPKRLRRPDVVQRFYNKLKAVEEERAKIALAYCKWLVGDDDAFAKAGFAKIDVAAQEAMEAPLRKKNKKK